MRNDELKSGVPLSIHHSLFILHRSSLTLMCLVGASALKSRWRVVFSVTLGGGTSSAVFARRGGIALTRAGAGGMALFASAPGSLISSPLPCLNRTYSAMPPPSIEKAGISIQNHQILPAGANAK